MEGAPQSPDATSVTPGSTPSGQLPRQVGRYTLIRQIGQGGMGVVYAARDERLGREVAVKMIAGLSGEAAVKRFWREARAAASVSHPNVCQVFEVDESSDGIYLAMELLDGESLEARLARSPCSPPEAVRVALAMLAALGSLHERGLVHRDIKPSNVFLTKHGAKLLDFGLARSISDETQPMGQHAASAITQPGMVVGTPRYMAPEQIRGHALDARTDLYAVGAVLFEMLAGRPPFLKDNPYVLGQAILTELPPALNGPAAVVALDRVIRRAMAKEPGARFATADAMAVELRQVDTGDDHSGVAVATVRTLLRVVVPPLRLSREDAEASFLSYGLAEAISASLATLGDVVVRSPAIASRWAGPDADLRALATEADVDVVVSGSLSRMGEQLRATLQLVDAGTGTVAGARSVRGLMSEIFVFEDALAKEVVALLAGMRSGATSGASAGVPAMARDVPANGRAFEFFLRGLELARTLTRTPEARDCFERALEHDPAFAPAWAWLARCHRVIGKYMEHYAENDRRADEAFRRALALSPELPVAHRFFTHYESEHGRADAAVARLLQHAKANRNDAQLFAALVHATRYAGLMGASFAAHEEARRLDPTVPTSVEFTMLLAGDVARLRAQPTSADAQGALAYLHLFAGRMDELRQLMATADLSGFPPSYRGMFEAVVQADTDPKRALADVDDAIAMGTAHDPEAVYLSGLIAVALGADAVGVERIAAAVRDGFTPLASLETAPVLARVRDRPAIVKAIEQARQRQRIALAIFERGDGPSLLGIRADQAT